MSDHSQQPGNSDQLTRREFIKNNAVAATAAAAGVTVPGVQAFAAPDDSGVRWDKAPCRFCGTGCSVLVGTKDGRVVATQGDPDAPVNRGLNCIKGYFLSKIMYGQDRIQQPLLRKKNGRFDKGRCSAVLMLTSLPFSSRKAVVSRLSCS